MFYVYILLCTDGSLYTGIAKDVEKRFAMHLDGTGAKYTRSHTPEKVVYREAKRTKGAALSREAAIKRLSKADKAAIIKLQAL